MLRRLRSKSLRIGIDGRELLGDYTTGIGRFLKNFLSSQTLLHCPHRIFIYGDQNTRWNASASPYHFFRLSQAPTFYWDQKRLPEAIKRDRLDVFLSPYDKGIFRAPCPQILTVHDLLFLKISDRRGFSKRLYNYLFRISRRLLLPEAAFILTVSEFSKRDILKTFPLKADRVIVTYNGVSDRYFVSPTDKDGPLIKDIPHLPENYVLYVGNYKPHKNVATLLYAYADLHQNFRNAHSLVLAGDTGPYRQEIDAIVSSLGIATHVFFAGIVAETDLPYLYRNAAVFAFPSLYEGFGLPPLEAMASGTPVVCSNATSLPEVVGKAALTVSPRDITAWKEALQDLLTNPQHRAAISQAGRQRAAQFKLEYTAERILQTIERAAKDHR